MTSNLNHGIFFYSRLEFVRAKSMVHHRNQRRICGTHGNLPSFYRRFDHSIHLTAKPSVMLKSAGFRAGLRNSKYDRGHKELERFS